MTRSFFPTSRTRRVTGISLVCCAALAALLTRCGGGSGSSGPPSPPPVQPALCSSGCVTTYRYDNTGQGVYANESTLKASTLASSGFRFSASMKVDGQVYAQPLFMSGLPISYVASSNAVFVATEHGSVYALDADSLAELTASSLVPAGQTTIPQADLPQFNGNPCNTITYEVGITSTPVIDQNPPTSSHDPILYAVVASKLAGNPSTYYQTLQGWDPIANRVGASLDIGQALGSGFNALAENQRAALVLAHDASGNALIYVEWASHCDAPSPVYQGTVALFKYDYSSSSFSLVSSLMADPQGQEGGIWMSGSAPVIDSATGDLYLETGNGNFKAGGQFGQTVLRLGSPGAILSATGSYTPNAWSIFNTGTGTVNLPAPINLTGVNIPGDLDLGSGGPILAYPAGQSGYTSAPFEVLAGGKEGVTYVIDPTNMGNGANGADDMDPCDAPKFVRQCFAAMTVLAGKQIPDGTGQRGVPAFWAGDESKGVEANILYTAGAGDTHLNYWQMPAGGNATFSTTVYATGKAPSDGGTNTFAYPGASPVVTWDGTDGADAIVWLVDSSGYLKGSPEVLMAYPALPTAGQQNIPPIFADGGGQGPGAVKFTVPVVVNGHVYVGGQQSGSPCVKTCSGLVAVYK
jgi:hypothetical protein